MEHYLIPIIQKKPSNILHVGTNDAKNLPSRTVLDNLLKLKALVRDSLPTCGVFISTPTLRTDDDDKAQITVRQLTKHLLQPKIDTINNNNINFRHLGGKGLHLNQLGSNPLSKNFVNAIQKF